MPATLALDFGVEYPIFAFSHCRDVVAEVSRCGGIGVLGAATMQAEQLEVELRWLDERTGGKPYGVDVLLPSRSADTGTRNAVQLAAEMAALVPTEHRRFVREVLEENGIPTRPLDAPFVVHGDVGITAAQTMPLIDVMLTHPGARLFVSALGTPPPDVIKRMHIAGIKVGALAGSVQHAQRHAANGVDLVIAQGTEAGGHTGEVTTMVLVPDVVDAIAPLPVAAAGGIGTGRQVAAALALGARGVWTGSIWLTVAEANTSEADRAHLFRAKSTDTVRSRSLTGKPIRQLRGPWTDAWARAEAPTPLQLPLQRLLVADAVADERLRGVRAAGLSRPIVGQIVSRINQVRSAQEVLDELVRDLVATVEGLSDLISEG